MKFRRASRKTRRRRGRKFTARPTRHDGLSVIAAYGNILGYALDGTVRGRAGHNEIECVDGYRVSVIAGAGANCLPATQITAMSWMRELREHQRLPDYLGPYTHLEVLPGRSRTVRTMPLGMVRGLLDQHGGFKRMVATLPISHRRSEGREVGRVLAKMARERRGNAAEAATS